MDGMIYAIHIHSAGMDACMGIHTYIHRERKGRNMKKVWQCAECGHTTVYGKSTARCGDCGGKLVSLERDKTTGTLIYVVVQSELNK